MPEGVQGVQCLVYSCVKHCIIGDNHLLEMETTKMTSQLLIPASELSTIRHKDDCSMAVPAKKTTQCRYVL